MGASAPFFLLPLRAHSKAVKLKSSSPWRWRLCILWLSDEMMESVERECPQIANHMFCMGLAEKSFNVSMDKLI